MSNEYNLQDKTNPLLSETHLQRSSSILPPNEGLSSSSTKTYDLSRGQNLEGNPPTGLGTPLMGEEGIFSSVELEPGSNFISVFSTNFRNEEHIAAYSFEGAIRRNDVVGTIALIKWNVGWKYINSEFTLMQSSLDINQSNLSYQKIIEPNIINSGGSVSNYNYPSLVGGSYVQFQMTLLNGISTTETFYIQGILEYWVVNPF